MLYSCPVRTDKAYRREDIIVLPRHFIKARLVERGVTMTEIAAACAVSVALVSMVASGQRRNRAVEEEIARRLHTPIGDLFPPTNEVAA